MEFIKPANRAVLFFLIFFAGCTTLTRNQPAAQAPTHPPQPGVAAPILGKKTLTVLAVGDVVMGSRISDHPALPPHNGRGLFDAVTPYLKGDIVFANLEGVFADGDVRSKCVTRWRKKKKKNCFQFVMPTIEAPRLKEAGFNVVNINNNHSFDGGKKGLQSTMQTLDSIGIKHTGLVGDVAEFTINGASVAVVGFGFDTDANFYNILKIPAASVAIQMLKSTHRIVIVAFHGGAEGESALHLPKGMEIFVGEHRGDLRKFARAVVDAGADLVLGSSPHVPRAMELYKGRLIAYSLGNFETFEKVSLKEDRCVAPLLRVDLNLADGSFASGRIIPFVQLGQGIPMPDKRQRAIGLMNKLSHEDIANNPIRIGNDGQISSAPAGVPK